MTVTISDGADHAIYHDQIHIEGEINDSRRVDGASGAWTLSVNPEGFAGRFRITLQCDDWRVIARAGRDELRAAAAQRAIQPPARTRSPS
jgi:hypothetical protein